MEQEGMIEVPLCLDGKGISYKNLELIDPGSGEETPRGMAVLFVKCVLRQALHDRCIAVNLFHDSEDDCLRVVVYFSEKRSGKTSWNELMPTPGFFAPQVLDVVRMSLSHSKSAELAELRYISGGREAIAAVAVPNPSEVQIYLSDERPTMRSKGV